jgi:proton-dependent oligopeptide transporter, POT family
MIENIAVDKIKQPKGLKVFCLSIFFERYGFYLVQGLLVLYLVKYFRTGDKVAYSILGSFIALCYIMPLLGGFIADKYWGLRKSIYIGAVIEGLGLLMLIVPGTFALIIGLSAIAMGMGLLKPCASSLLGFLYDKDDPRQDSGYTIFYVVFNGGIILATFISGFLVRYVGWKVAFLTAVVALIITFFIFYFGFIKYKLNNLGPNVTSTFKGNAVSLIIIIVAIALSSVILKYETLALIAFIAVSISVIGIFVYCIIKSEKEYKSKLVAFFILLVISTVYWALYMQMFLSITLFIENVVNKILMGITIPTPAFASIESFGVIIFGYPIARLWLYLSKTKYNPSLPLKFCFGMILLCASFGALAVGSHFVSANGFVNPIWIVIAYLVMAIGELALSPIGLSMVNVLVPEEFNGMMMGIFLLTIGLGGKIAGLLAQIATVPENSKTDTSAILSTYNHAFNTYFLITVVCTVIALLFIPYIKKKMGEKALG